jgi:GT2 family glycosyltransferase
MSGRAAVASLGSSPRLAVIIPTRGRPRLLNKVLNALAVQTFPVSAFEVIVVMDGPDAATEQMIQENSFPFSLRALTQPRQGTAAARSLGVCSASAPLLIFIDDDIVTTPGFLQAHYKAHQEEEQVVVLGALKPPPEPSCNPFGQAIDWTQGYFDRCSAPGYRPVCADLLAANFSVAKEVLLDAGGWDKEFHGYGGGEDKDLALRLAGQGLRFQFSVEALGYHHQTKGWADMLKDVRQGGRAYPHYLSKHPHETQSISWAISSPLRRFLFRVIGICPVLLFIGIYALARLADLFARNGARGRGFRTMVRLSANVVAVCGIWETPGGARQILNQLAQSPTRTTTATE